ncbi:MAG TPA: serine hydrolase domain-containing protein [Flavisolibacter sp.]|jgi:CubicO group peptidase (beta-lactamase class C family)|nr:serine hydrolase domain-containing protein [Flavisolibacter sp.]
MRAFFVLTVLFLSTQLPAQIAVQYPLPVFTDPQRVEKIKAALPVIDKLYKDFAARVHSPAFVYGVVVDGQLIGTGQTGHIQVDKKLPATTRSAFRIASMTKSFTAMAILQLRDAGNLQLDDPVSKYIPAFAQQAYPATDAPTVTIRHLLTHAAGFPEDNPWGDRQLAKSEEEFMALVNKGIHYSNVPGVAYEYSNLGFTLLGQIIKTVTGQPYQEYITQHILKPLGMAHTYWEFGHVPAAELAHGYRRVNGNWAEQPLLHDGAWGAMGGMITTIEDFSKYMAMHLSAWPPRSEKENPVLKRSSLREMHHPWNLYAINWNYAYPSGRQCPTAIAYTYGLRWTKDCEGRIGVGHSGGLPGFGSNWQVLPEYGIGVVCFSNVTYAPTTTINNQVLDTLVALAKLKPRQVQPSSILQTRKEQLVKLLPHWQGAETLGIFADNFFLDYFTDSLRKEATGIFSKAGKITRVGEIVPENGLRGSFLLEGEKGNIEVFFTLTPETVPMIQQYRIRFRDK